MEAFVKHTGIIAPLDKPDIDTDQIIPKQFLKRVERNGFGQFMFYNWRYKKEGVPNPEFILNLPSYSGCSIIATRRNFGSGSSREHAVWALSDFGIKCIIAPSFALSRLILSIALSKISNALTAFSLVLSFTVLNFCKLADPGEVENKPFSVSA